MKTNKKTINEIGVGIILMAILLLLGNLLVDNTQTNSKNKNYFDSDSEENLVYNSENYFFRISETTIGKQQTEIETYSNIYLGTKTEFKTIYLGNTFYLHSNPFNSNINSIKLDLKKYRNNTKSLLLYFDTERNGDEDLKIFANGQLVSRNKATSKDIPILIIEPKKYLNENSSKLIISFQLNKPSWYDFFNWNKVEIRNLKIVQEIENNDYKEKIINFNIDRTNLKNLIVDMTISCSEYSGKEIAPPIIGLLNDQEVFSENPNCISRFTKITANIPSSILKNIDNELKITTSGFYKVALRLKQVYYNEQDIYYFNVNSFNDFYDAFLFGDFDKNAIDLRLNGKYISLKRGEGKSVITYLRHGVNEIEILTKPIEIKNLYIEKIKDLN
jgi:hypothetical protein